jgi:hypothetical protein
MLSLVFLSPLIFSFVRCAPSPSFDAFPQAAGFAKDANIQTLSESDTSQPPPSIGGLYSRPNAMSDSPDFDQFHVSAVRPAQVDPPSFQVEVTNDSVRSPLVMAYYPDWVGSDFPPKKIDFTLFDWIDFAFALPDEYFNLTWDSDDAPMLLKQLVSEAHSAKKKVKLSIGGWTGSK